jgi:UDP-N-acetylglucosamine 4,6-dehydratase/5-epimerase
MFQNKKVLITGGAGTCGQEITRQLLKLGVEEIVIFSRDEASQVAMKQKFCDDRLRFVIGDIRDRDAIMEACYHVNIVFHTAALKHSDKCEIQPREAVKTNIYGVQNVIEACLLNNIEKCVNISTDKVCNSNCTYGKTKAVAESLFTEANNQSVDTDFISVRSGNILGSAGSVVPIWINQIKQTNSINITGDMMKRFFITVHDAVKYTFEAMRESVRGEVFIFRMPAFYILDLGKAVIEKYGNKHTIINNIGKQPGERNNEWLITNEEAERAVIKKHYFVLYPIIPIMAMTPPEINNPTKAYSLQDSDYGDITLLHKMLSQAGY